MCFTDKVYNVVITCTSSSENVLFNKRISLILKGRKIDFLLCSIRPPGKISTQPHTSLCMHILMVIHDWFSELFCICCDFKLLCHTRAAKKFQQLNRLPRCSTDRKEVSYNVCFSLHRSLNKSKKNNNITVEVPNTSSTGYTLVQLVSRN